MLFTLLAASLSLAPIQEREPQVFRSGIRVIRLDVSVGGEEGPTHLGVVDERLRRQGERQARRAELLRGLLGADAR